MWSKIIKTIEEYKKSPPKPFAKHNYSTLDWLGFWKRESKFYVGRRPTKHGAAYTMLLRRDFRNSWFSLVMWRKLKTVTIQWIKSRIGDTIDDWYINNLAKNQVFAVFHSRVICRSVSPKFIELCMETPCLCPSEGHKYGGRKVTETSVTEFCYWSEKLWL